MTDFASDASDARAVVSAAYLYPVKACGAWPVERLTIDRWGGAEGDRRWAVLNAEGQVTWQGDWPRLARVHPRLEDGALVLHAEGRAPLVVRDDDTLQACEIGLWNDTARRADRFPARAAGEAADRWISEVAGGPVRLVRLGDEAVGRPHAERLHVLTQESVDEVDATLRSQGAPAADLRRYRPNLVLRGATEPLVPFLEELIEQARWPGGRLDFGARCVRCVVPDVDPVTARTSPETGHALAELAARRYPGQATSLGMYARATPGGALACGDVLALTLAF